MYPHSESDLIPLYSEARPMPSPSAALLQLRTNAAPLCRALSESSSRASLSSVPQEERVAIFLFKKFIRLVKNAITFIAISELLLIKVKRDFLSIKTTFVAFFA